MKYIAVFDVPDEWTPNRFDQEASATFELTGKELPSATHPLPGDYYRVERARLQKLPDRIPPEWNTAEAAGFNVCLDRLEGG